MMRLDRFPCYRQEARGDEEVRNRETRRAMSREESSESSGRGCKHIEESILIRFNKPLPMAITDMANVQQHLPNNNSPSKCVVCVKALKLALRIEELSYYMNYCCIIFDKNKLMWMLQDVFAGFDWWILTCLCLYLHGGGFPSICD